MELMIEFSFADNHADSIASGEDEFSRTKNEEMGQNGQESTPRRGVLNLSF